jgi:hypothetical protein
MHLRAGIRGTVVALLLVSSGCAGYRLGPVNGMAAGEKGVEVQPFVNRTLEPRLTDAVTGQLRREIQRDGTFKLATPDNSDIVVKGTLTRYYRDALSYAPTDTLTGRDYRLILTAQVTAVDRPSGKVLLDQAITGYTLVRIGSDLASTERQALPLLAEDMARNITAALAEGSW